MPSQLLGAADVDRAADALYVGTLLASSASLSWLTEHIKRTPAIRSGEADQVHAGPVWVTTTCSPSSSWWSSSHRSACGQCSSWSSTARSKDF